jgi:hypothetical protein
VPDPYREPMPQSPPPRDGMRIVLIVAGAIAGVIAAVAIAFGVVDARSSRVASTADSSAPPSLFEKLFEKPAATPREEAKPVQDLPLVADDSDTPSDFELEYTSPDSMIPSYTVRIAANGEATMTYVSGEGVIAKLTPDVVRGFWHLVSRHQFFRWESNMANDHPGMTDHFPQSLSATARSLHNSITCLDRCPKGADEIVTAILDQTHPNQWTMGRKELPQKKHTGSRDSRGTLLDTR